MILHDKVFQL